MASTHILLVGKIEEGEIHYDIAPLPWVDPHESIELPPLQDTIDEAAELEDYLSDIEDRNIWRRGNW